MKAKRQIAARVSTVAAAPRAAMLIESMRDIGYSLESALADIVDNSITAGASTVRLFAQVNSTTPRIAILDDGKGMTRAELLDAMRPGSRSPLEARESSDLGRFGLGLKTASFSQCRRLTVVSRRDGIVSAARWDLDFVAEVNDWLLEVPEEPLDIPWTDRLGSQGTLVLWEQLDRLTDSGSPEEVQQHFVRRLDEARDHLELVFHRFLAGEKGLARLSVALNERPLVPFDPFHSTQSEPGPVERISKDVAIQAFTLPHHSKVSSADWEKYAGKAGYTRNQGFYVYRGKRLIIHGTWFGLARQLELTKLARVRIDLPNTLDDDWKIDVRKSSAQPPRQVRDRLRKLLETIGAGSKRVYRGRGTRLASRTTVPVWQRLQDKNEVRYRVNLEHPFLAEFRDSLPERLKVDFQTVLDMVAAGLPIDSLFADTAGEPDHVTGGVLSLDAHRHIVETTFRHLISTGLKASDVIDMLRVTDLFKSNWEATEEVLDGLVEEMQADE